jgi:hypothetical protein
MNRISPAEDKHKLECEERAAAYLNGRLEVKALISWQDVKQ